MAFMAVQGEQNPAKNFYGYGSGSSNPAKYGPLLQNATGTGEQFLGSFHTGREGAGVLDPLRTRYTGKFDYRGPQYMAQFLQGEFGPGGYLSPGQQSLETAGRINSMQGGFRQAEQNLFATSAASGLNGRFVRERAAQGRELGGYQVNEALFAGMGESNSRRFQAMLNYTNMASQTQMAQLRDETNYNLAKKGAKATQMAGLTSGIATVAGAWLGGPPGAALANQAAGAMTPAPAAGAGSIPNEGYRGGY